MSSAWAESPPHGRLVSLWDVMINFQVFGLCHNISDLRREEDIYERWKRADPIMVGLWGPPPPLIRAPHIERIAGFVKFSDRVAQQLELQAVHDRVELFFQRTRDGIALDAFIGEIRALRDALEKGIAYKYFYRYPQAKALRLLKFESEWGSVLSKFASARGDALAGVDCWALGYSNASIFHFMRAAERGLRALAKERRVKLAKDKPLEWGQWQEIIRETRKQFEEIGRTAPPGLGKDEALAFYSGALAHAEAFKDKYRNVAFHARDKNYDELEAESAMNHVREFLAGLATKLDENGKPIRWKFR